MPEALPAALAYSLQAAEILAAHLVPDRDDREDAAQEARLAVWRAWLRFDATRGVKFTTYGWHAALGAIRHYVRDAGGARSRRARYQVRQARRGCPLRGASTAAAALLPPLSLDAPAESAEGAWLPETAADPRPSPEAVVLARAAVAEVLAVLRPDLARVLWERYAEGRTAEEVAARAGCQARYVFALEARGRAAFVAAWEAASAQRSG